MSASFHDEIRKATAADLGEARDPPFLYLIDLYAQFNRFLCAQSIGYFTLWFLP